MLLQLRVIQISLASDHDRMAALLAPYAHVFRLRPRARPRALPPPFTAQAGLADVPLSPLGTALSFIAGAPGAPSKAALAKGCKEAYGVADTLLAQAAARAHAHAHEHRNTRASHACIPVICCVHERRARTAVWRLMLAAVV